MELPAPLRAAVDRTLEGVPLADLQRATRRLTERYRAETRDGTMHLDDELAMRAYLAARLPATYAAVRSAMQVVAAACPDFSPRALIDFGAGPGTALFAAADCWPGLGRAALVEASPAARHIGQALTREAPLPPAEWVAADITAATAVPQPAADLATLCYVLDELPPAALPGLAGRLWQATGGVLLIVEPGTPGGWRRIGDLRAALLSLGAHVVAPCPHALPCPVAPPDWCHFSRRVARSRMHRLAKSGDVPWEDEKFSYLAVSRTPPPAREARILAPPRTAKGHITLKLCTPEGTLAQRTVSKRDGESYRAARRLDWGDSL